MLAERYVRALDPGALASARTVPQLIAQLRDPFTSYLTSAEYAALKADTVQGFYGVGVRVRAQGTAALRIVGVMPRSPAARAGLHEGDLLVAVDGLRVRGHIDTALAALQAPHRGPLRLLMKRTTGREHVVAVRRARRPAARRDRERSRRRARDPHHALLARRRAGRAAASRVRRRSSCSICAATRAA